MSSWGICEIDRFNSDFPRRIFLAVINVKPLFLTWPCLVLFLLYVQKWVVKPKLGHSYRTMIDQRAMSSLVLVLALSLGST